MSWTFITVTFIQDVYIFKKYSTKRQLLKTGRLLKTKEYVAEFCISGSFIIKKFFGQNIFGRGNEKCLFFGKYVKIM